ncbi:MAG: hypothetical protein LRS49_04415 [Desulfurococcales archaeon]|nr:hypothetical protein [Desulfurococcales archaeon]
MDWRRDAGVFGLIGSMALAGSAVGAYAARAGMGGAFIAGLSLFMAAELASRSGLRAGRAGAAASMALLLAASIAWARALDTQQAALAGVALLLAGAGILARPASYPGGLPGGFTGAATLAGGLAALAGGVLLVAGAGWWAASLWPLGSLAAGAGEYAVWARVLGSGSG